VAVIDEIQMIRDPQRGWAWTRAFLGKLVGYLNILFINLQAKI